MRFLLFVLILVILHAKMYAQYESAENNRIKNSLNELTIEEKIQLQTLPLLTMPESYKNKSIPYSVDNTTKIYYPGLFLQTGPSCGQAAAVSLGFAYEINRLRVANGSLLTNQYPTHFSWNWVNGGNGWYGGSYFHSFELLRSVGTPNIETYGGTHYHGGGSRFMSGYDNYYQAMHNRIKKAYAIDCSTEEGIMTLKHYLNDHLDGSESGGIAFFYAQYQSINNYLPEGTEHEGEPVVVHFGASPNHAWAITGYNDSVRWDYNGDGQYTNHLDINGDGVVDVRDWEIGAFKLANTYATAYDGWMMYKTLAEPSNNGGIWNNAVNVVYPLKNYTPSLTYKINMNYDKRRKIKIMAGMSTDINAEEPDYYMSFPIFDFQGASFPMDGTNNDIEFGLDVSPFLNYIDPQTQVKFFFIIIEDDAGNTGTGFIESFSVRDYSGNQPIEISSDQTNVDINVHSTTTLSLVHTPGFSKPEITTDVLQNINVYSPLNIQLEAESGKPPYRWEFDTDYSFEEISSFDYNSLSNINQGSILLPFDFNFFGKTYNYIYVSAYGYVDFSYEPHNLPYNSDTHISFVNRKNIGVYYSDIEFNISKYEGSDYLIIKWENTEVTAILKLEESGEVSIFYEEINPPHTRIWSAGLSSGEMDKTILVPFSGGVNQISNKGYRFIPSFSPEEFELSEQGVLSGMPTQIYNDYEINVKVTDLSGIINRKTIPLSTNGLSISYNINTENNDSIEWGQTVEMDVDLLNLTETIITNLQISLQIDNENITITNNNQNVGILNPHEEITIENAFTFNLNYNFQNAEQLDLKIIAEYDQDYTEVVFTENVYTGQIAYLSYDIQGTDQNFVPLDEDVDVVFEFINDGGSSIEDVLVLLSTEDEYLTIIENEKYFNIFNPQQIKEGLFTFYAPSSTPSGHSATVDIHIIADNGYTEHYTALFIIGENIEDWETGDFSKYNWSHAGDQSWYIVTDEVYEGDFAVRSGNIGHNQSTSLILQVEVLAAGNISFYRKVSCEEAPNLNYDYLSFSIDGEEKNRWDGEKDWELVSYVVEPGIRTFKWTYSKDASVSAFQDCAWIDFIAFPPINDPESSLVVSQNYINKTMPAEEIESEFIEISNTGGGVIEYTVEIFESSFFNNKSVRSVEGSYIECFDEAFYKGDSVHWDFMVYNGSPDQEWLKQINIDFPQGFEVIEISNIIDDSNDTLHIISGEPGFGASFTWFGETDAGWGLITGGERGYFNVLGYVAPDFEGDMVINYEIFGDIYGSEPHQIDSFLTITNYGERIEWLTVVPESGQLGFMESKHLELIFNTEGLQPGLYESVVRIIGNTDTIYVDIQLTVEHPVLINEDIPTEISLFPNPSSGKVNIISNVKINNIEIYSLEGKVLQTKQPHSDNIILSLNHLNPGIYFVYIRTDIEIRTKKLIIE